jgi:hypothetical protein
MANVIKATFLEALTQRYGNIHKLPSSLSLYDLGVGAGRIYIRYSKIHPANRTFYGLRKKDLQQLEGRPSAICFLWEGQAEPLFIPYSEYEEVFQSVSPADDGQYKVQIFLQEEGCDFYIANAGRFNAEAYFGWHQLDSLVHQAQLTDFPDLSHIQVQTLLGSIGHTKGYNVWIPKNDRMKLDWTLAKRFACSATIPGCFAEIQDTLSEIDVVWVERDGRRLRALFEVEHSTPIYSGLLRFNDVHLTNPSAVTTYSIVSNDARRSLFVRQLNRPTFTTSRLSESCTFLEYPNVFTWHRRLVHSQGKQP